MSSSGASSSAMDTTAGSAAESSAASSSAAASASAAPAAAPSASPAPVEEHDAAEDALLEDEALDEDDLADGGNKKGGKGRGSSSVIKPPADALDRLNDLLKKTEQFSKFVPGKTEAVKKGRGRAGGRHHDRAEEDEEDKELVADSTNAEKSWPDHLEEQPTSVEKNGGSGMRQYQLEALNWMINLHDQNLNGILADEMGLGKTLESLSLLAYLKQYRKYAGPHLIVVPKSTSSNWLREVKRWTNNLTVHRFHGNQEERDAQKPLVSTNDVTITTYEMVIREKGFLGKFNWKYIYIDEAHRIKNEKSLLSRVIRTFKSEHRLLITGTPLQNNLHELWALLNFLVPDMFNSAEDFASWFDFTEPEQRDEIVGRLHKLLRPFLLRRLKSEVEKALLPKIETKLFVGMSVMQKQWYKKILERDIAVLNANNSSKTTLLNIVMQLRKVCCHPYLFQGAEPGPPFLEGEHLIDNSSKMVLLDRLLKKLKANGHRVLIFSQMTRLLDILEDFCRIRSYEYCRIDGQTKQDERDEAMESYNAPNSSKFLFLLSTRAGGLGINLQTADTVILYDSDWNPQADLQAMDRAHRIGQKKQVTVFRFVVENSIEQKMVERATKKLFLDALVVKQGRLNEAEKSVTSQELADMVRFGANRIFHSENDTDITDEDIDLILARGSELTRAENEKLKANQQNDLLNFNLTEEKGSFQTFEGKDYTGVRSKHGFEFIEPTKRERRTNYDINQYYRDALRVSEKKDKRGREYKAPVRLDYQFFNTTRLEELEKKDHEAKQRLRVLKMARRLKRKEEKRVELEKEKEARKKARYQRRKQQMAEAAAAGQATTDVKEDSDSDEEMEDAKADAAAATAGSSEKSAPAAATAAAAPAENGAAKMEIDGDASVKKEGEPTAAAPSPAPSTTDSTAVKMEDVDSAPKTELRRSTRGETPSVSASPQPQTDAAAAGGDEDDDENEEKDQLDSIEEEEMRQEAGCLSPEERAEMEKLQAEGFPTWSRRHVQNFVRVMEKYGRDDLANIKLHVEEKTAEEVERYYAVFWKKYKEIKEWDRFIKQIEKGEAKLQKQKALQLIIDEKVKKYKGNFEAMTIPYPTNQQRTFTEEEDKFIIVSVHRLGYGNWEDLKSAIRTSWMFRFDWFIKSRTCGELSKRVEYLIKLLEKEQLEWKEKKKQAEAKRKEKIKQQAQMSITSFLSKDKKKAPASAPSSAKKKTSDKSKDSKKKPSSSSSSSSKKKDSKDSKDSKSSSTKKKEKDSDSSKKSKKKSKDEDKKDKDKSSKKKDSSKSKDKEKDSKSDKKKEKKPSSAPASSSSAASPSASKDKESKKRKAESAPEAESDESKEKKQKTKEEN